MTRPDQTRPDQTRPDQTRPDQTRPVLWLLVLFGVNGFLFDFFSSGYTWYIRTPLNLPSLGDFSMLVWLLLSSMIFLKILNHLGYVRLTPWILILFFLLYYGEGIHLVGNSIQMKLFQLGYLSNLTEGLPYVPSLPKIDPIVLPIFSLLYFYDEILGHIFEFTGILLFFLVFYFSSFSRQPTPSAINDRFLFFSAILINGFYLAWAVIEGEVIWFFLIFIFFLGSIKLYHGAHQLHPNAIGKVFEATFCFVGILLFVWFATVGHFQSIPQFFEQLRQYL